MLKLMGKKIFTILRSNSKCMFQVVVAEEVVVAAMEEVAMAAVVAMAAMMVVMATAMMAMVS